jgi:NAD(P)-dependent dehydrogenase (short-subunit alcohol dehydrogenase family)
MDLLLKDKVALVTGTGSAVGYGRNIVKTLAEEGCKIVSADIDKAGAEASAEEARKLGVPAIAVGVDVTDRASVDAMVAAAVKEFGRIDILVNNAGASSVPKPFIKTSRADWDKDISINLYGQMNVAQAVLPQMLEQKYGRVIMTTGGRGLPTISVYGAAKNGIVALTHSLALELADTGIVVNCIAPGLGKTGLTSEMPEQMVKHNENMSALRRLCRPEDMGPAVAFLASDKCSYMTGQVLNLNTF